MRVQYIPSNPLSRLGYGEVGHICLTHFIDRALIDIDFKSYIVSGAKVADLRPVDGIDPAGFIARAWDYYDLARPAIFAAGDSGEMRGFLPQFFGKMLDRAETEMVKEARLAKRQEADEAFVSAEDRIMADMIEAMSLEQREVRARSILNDLEYLEYRPFSVNIRSRRERLQTELRLLTAHMPENEKPVVVGSPVVALVSALLGGA